MNPVAKICEWVGNAPGKQVMVWCPGCKSMHPFTIESDGRLNRGITWDWNDDLEKPTFNPSLLCYSSVHKCEGQHEVTLCPREEGGECDRDSHTIGYLVDGVPTQLKVWEAEEKGVREFTVYLHVGPHPAPYDNKTAWGQCHSFLRDGVWEFLSDCDHALANQRVPMEPLPDWFVNTNED